MPSNVFLVRFGVRRWFACILITWGAITVAMSLINGPMSSYVLRFLLSAAEAVFYPGVVFYLNQWFPARHRGRIFGLFLFSQPFALIVTGPLAGGLLGMEEGVAGLHGWQWLFILTGLPAILLAWPTLRFFTDTPTDAKWLSAEDRAWLMKAELDQEHRTGARVEHANPLRALKDVRVLLLALYFLPYPLAIYGLSMWLPTIVKGFGVSNLTTGFLSAIPYVFAVAGLLTVPRHSDKTDERLVHIACSALLGAASLFVLAAQSPVVQLGALCFTAFGLYAAQPIFWTLPSRFLAGPAAAAGIALINSIGNLGGYIGPFAVGVIKQHTGNLADGLYFLAGGVFVLAVLLTIMVKVMIEPRSGPGGNALAE